MKINSNEEIARYLEGKGVKPTANRILVVRELMQATHPVSLSELESALEPMDKSAIFRTLELLTEKELLHSIDDGSRSQKYELCTNHDHDDISHHHVHFYCENCKATFCFDDIAVPAINIPEGFSAHSVNYVVKGLCPKCR